VPVKATKVAYEVEEAVMLEDAARQHVEAVRPGRGERITFDRAPGEEPLPGACQRAEPRIHPVGDDEQFVRPEERRDLCLVRLELVERVVDRRVFVGRVLQLADGERQSVDVDDDVGATSALFENRELVDGEPVVRRRVVEVDETHELAAYAAAIGRHLDLDAVHEASVEAAVPLYERRRVHLRQYPFRLCERRGWQIGVEPRKRGSQPSAPSHSSSACSATFSS